AQSRRRSKRSSKALLYKSRQYQLQRCTARCCGSRKNLARRLRAMEPSSTSSVVWVRTLTLAHEGTKAYSESFELVHRREADGPIWQAAHTSRYLAGLSR